jgi:hypothetical protein
VNRVAVLFAFGVTVVVGTSACTSGSTVATAVVAHARGFPPGVTKPPSDLAAGIPKPFATWAQADQIYVTTWGSSSCPMLPTSVNADGAHEVRIKTAEHGEGNCTADAAATTSTVRLPAETDDTAALTIDVDGTPTHLSPRPR